MSRPTKLISTLLLWSLAQVSLANTLECPSLKEIRDKVKLTRSTLIDISEGPNFVWRMASDPFESNQANWNVLFTTTIDFTVNPIQAVEQGQPLFNASILREAVIKQRTETSMICNYTPEGAKYTVFALTPAIYGLSG